VPTKTVPSNEREVGTTGLPLQIALQAASRWARICTTGEIEALENEQLTERESSRKTPLSELQPGSSLL
jgi:hypothetical protein